MPRRFWLYAAFTAISMLGFATFAVLAYHQEVSRVVAPAVIPITFAAAMGIHGSTMRAAVADLVPAAVRGTG